LRTSGTMQEMNLCRLDEVIGSLARWPREMRVVLREMSDVIPVDEAMGQGPGVA